MDMVPRYPKRLDLRSWDGVSLDSCHGRQCQHIGAERYLAARPTLLPLVLPSPLPMLEPLRALCMLEAVVSADVLVLAPLPTPEPLVSPRTRPLVPRATRPVDDEEATRRLRSSSSAFRRAASRRRSTSAALRSASCCLYKASLSISTRSCVAPFQFGFVKSRWLCSVCDRMRVHVLRSVEALVTVLDTVCCALSASSSSGNTRGLGVVRPYSPWPVPASL